MSPNFHARRCAGRRTSLGIVCLALTCHAVAGQNNASGSSLPTYEVPDVSSIPEAKSWTDLIKIGGEIQFRYVANFDANTGGSQDDFEGGFQVARARLKIAGEIPDSHFSYKVIGGFSRSDGDFTLDDAYIDWTPNKTFSLRVGQFKLPFTREYSATAPTKMLLLDRSLADSEFRADRSQGVMMTVKNDRLSGSLAFSDGRGAKNTDFTSASEADASVSVRAQVRFGEASWKQFGDMTSFRGDKTGVLLGIGGHWQQDGQTTAPALYGEDPNYWGFTADIGVEGNGWNAMAAFYGAHITGNGESLTDFGLTAQAGVFLSDHTELVARYSHVFPDDGERGANADDFAAYSIGMNYYFVPKSHVVKFQAELVYYPTAQADSSALIGQSTLLGLRSDSDDEQFALMFQFQILF